jgi:hypothetical protein
MSHHFNPASSIIIPPSPSGQPVYRIVFVNNVTQEHVTMTIPVHGMFDDTRKAITYEEVQNLANRIGQTLYDSPDGA